MLEDNSELRKFLENGRLSQYYEALIQAGWDDIDYMKGLEKDTLMPELKTINMKTGHILKFIDLLKAA